MDNKERIGRKKDGGRGLFLPEIGAILLKASANRRQTQALLLRLVSLSENLDNRTEILSTHSVFEENKP
jgi:hypothetical protein